MPSVLSKIYWASSLRFGAKNPLAEEPQLPLIDRMQSVIDEFRMKGDGFQPESPEDVLNHVYRISGHKLSGKQVLLMIAAFQFQSQVALESAQCDYERKRYAFERSSIFTRTILKILGKVPKPPKIEVGAKSHIVKNQLFQTTSLTLQEDQGFRQILMDLYHWGLINLKPDMGYFQCRMTELGFQTLEKLS
jgi:hypothetical protein